MGAQGIKRRKRIRPLPKVGKLPDVPLGGYRGDRDTIELVRELFGS